MGPLRFVEFERYKAFADRQTMEVRPITLLFGHNSVGKSAALRLLPVLAHSAGDHRPESFSPSILNYLSPALRGATFSEIMNRGTRSGLSFSLKWADCEYSITLRQNPSTKPLSRHELVSDFEMRAGAKVLLARLTDPDEETYELTSGDWTETAKLAFDGLKPALPANLTGDFGAVQEALRSFSSSVYWLAAVRAQPPRIFTLEPGTPTRISHDGAGTAEALRISALRGDGVAEAVSAWLAKACACELSFAATDGQVFHDREWFPFQVRSSGGAVAVPDVGEGVSQALPVVTLCHQAASGQLGAHPILALEQPELHLHPRAGTLLAEEIVACVAGGSPATHLVETHSENFLLALQVALLEGKLTRDQLLVYWVESGADGAQLRRIEFDDAGYASAGWPEGVFREALEQARRISELRIA
ncbi:MAG: AAA family ATPase [bacterium]|nr:AAA family ATPase [bacterium]